MGARPRALVILISLMVTVVSTALLLVSASSTVDSKATRRGIRVAGATATNPALFKGEVLVWSPEALSAIEVGRVRDSSKVAGISAVRTGTLPAVSGRRAYPAIPVEAMSVDPDAYVAAAGPGGRQLLDMLDRGDVVLSRTGASLRKLRKGGHLRLTGSRSLTVSGIVDDRLLSGYEVAMDLERGRRLGVVKVSYLLLRPRGSVAGLQAAVRGLLHGRKLGFRLPGTTQWFRAGEATLPLAQVKLRFGEFAVSSLGRPVLDPSWVRANITTRLIPVLGQIRCHRTIVADLGAAMADLQRQGLDALIDVAAVQRSGGCLPAGAVSAGLRHQAWGIALDLGGTTRVDQRLVAAMARHGFTWGGRWLPPAAGRFEWVGAGA